MSVPHIIYVCPLCHLCAKNFHSLWKFDKVLTKIILHSFLRQGVVAKTCGGAPPKLLVLTQLPTHMELSRAATCITYMTSKQSNMHKCDVSDGPSTALVLSVN